MKKIILTFLLLTFIFSCNKNEDTTEDLKKTGIKGVFKYGEGDCFPPIDESSRTYNNYNGTLYFVNQTEFETSKNTETLKTESATTVATDGVYEIELTKGSYIIMTDDDYFESSNIVNIEENIFKTENLIFYNCTSF